MGMFTPFPSIRHRHATAVRALTALIGAALLYTLPAGPALADCTNCSTTNVGDDVVHEFTSGSGTFTAPSGVTQVEYLVVGGGGGGGGVDDDDNPGGGGGGAGGYQAGTLAVTPGVALDVVVGDGGAGGHADPGPSVPGENGEDSVFHTITAIGGGGGATDGSGDDGEDGGSGGGGRDVGNGGSGTPGQGNDGGDTEVYAGAGGGGAAEAGESLPFGFGDSDDDGGDGGDGVANDITGISAFYAGGGGGGAYNDGGSDFGGDGGAGGGGDAPNSRGPGGDGFPNTGGGGGGASGSTSGSDVDGGDGGSGVVIVRYSPPVLTPGEATGNVYRDYNANGERDAGEPPIEGVVVTAYDADGNTATTTTDANGDYSISADDGSPSDLSGPVRIEFTLPGDGSLDFLQPGVAGGTTVQFADIDDGAIELDVGFNNPAQFAPDTGHLVTSIARAGNSNAPGYTEEGEDSVIAIDYDVGDPRDANISLGAIEDVGSLWGLAYQRSTSTVFAAASLKRHAGFGPLGELGIYAIDASDLNNPGAVVEWVNLDTLGIPFNPVTRSGGAQFELPANASTPSWDVDAYTKVGKTSLGDIDFDENDRTLWIVNLHDRSLYGIENVDPGVTPDSDDLIGPFAVDDSGLSCNNGELRPWGVKSHDGRVYVGTVCSGEYSGASRSDLTGHVLVFDRDTETFTSVLDINFDDTDDYDHPMTPSESSVPGQDRGDGWQTWYFVDQFQSRDDMVNYIDGGNYKARYAVPMLTDIEFDAAGNMIVGVKSRFGTMQGQQSYAPNPGNTQLVHETVGAGDVLRACLIDGSFVPEGSPGCPGNPSADDEGPGGTEFFNDDHGEGDNDLFREQATGALARMPGRDEVVTTVYDPIEFFSNGVEWYSTEDGSENKRYEIYEGSDLPLFGKGHGLGDIELLAEPAPIELGNRVWDDYDGDGIQGPGEPGISDVDVGLYDGDGVLVYTATTDGDGNYLFSSDSRGTSTGSHLYGLDLDPEGDYSIALLDGNFESGGALETYSGTFSNLAGTSNDALLDVNDSDGVEVAVGSNGGSASLGVGFTNQGWGHNNHGFDFGLAWFDLGDAPDSYGTTLAGGARHLIARDSTQSVLETLYLGDPPNPESDGQPTADADGDGEEEDGVTFRSPSGTNNSLFADVAVVNNTGGTVTVCAWLDIPDGNVDGVFDDSDGMCQTTSSTSTTLTFQWSGLPTDQAYLTYARFRVTSDSLTTTDATGTVSDGEIEDYRVQFDFTPTVATIGDVGLDATSAQGFLAGLGVDGMESGALTELLASWDPEAAAAFDGAQDGMLQEALVQYLDPDGDGQVAVFRWDTLEERGTIGFYVERREGVDRWVRINNDMLPGLVSAPMGAEYLLADPGAESGLAYEYRLIEQEANGNTRTYGPFSVEMP